eukprot:CAMPEP_0201968884 /NCGR_PEP_ID=MMETSP0904-20121228/17534_1 /ASSEMBLY_ACC=CAM_ASM_000553 /TAXON_ID=420261 /ORGANISM="Thalassiosira antarctica, Strain CCMP982" /LENGTH=133 /DNA_ID=CAMNT_0048516937 /DNA_START=71 /DNA_END=473 /DNA_ORIENTATION=+
MTDLTATMTDLKIFGSEYDLCVMLVWMFIESYWSYHYLPPIAFVAELIQVQAEFDEAKEANKELLAHITRMECEKMELGCELERTNAKLSESNQSNVELTASIMKLLDKFRQLKRGKEEIYQELAARTCNRNE